MYLIRQELQQDASPHILGPQSETTAVKELFVLATLLYFERKSKQLTGPSNKTDKWIDDAFLILSEIEYCNKPFPLFILGREAQTDHRRLLVLDIIDRTIKKNNAIGLVSLREMLPKLWIQDDLNAGGNAEDTANWCSLLSDSDFVVCLL